MYSVVMVLSIDFKKKVHVFVSCTEVYHVSNDGLDYPLVCECQNSGAPVSCHMRYDSQAHDVVGITQLSSRVGAFCILYGVCCAPQLSSCTNPSIYHVASLVGTVVAKDEQHDSLSFEEDVTIHNPSPPDVSFARIETVADYDREARHSISHSRKSHKNPSSSSVARAEDVSYVPRRSGQAASEKRVEKLLSLTKVPLIFVLCLLG